MTLEAGRQPRYPDLDGKVAVVTGASRGIGRATALALTGNGAAVALIARDRQALAAVAGEIETDGGRAVPVPADCTVEDELQRAAQTIAAQLGPPDIVAAFAGGQGAPVPTVEETPAHWRHVLESDLTSAFLTVSAFLPGMVDRHRGTVITMSSSAARQAARSNAAYAAAKAGVVAFSRHLAGEYAGDGIRVNCLAPSAVENERMRTHMTDSQREALGASFPLRRIGQPEDIAQAVLFLASEASGWITGLTLDVSGGKVML